MWDVRIHPAADESAHPYSVAALFPNRCPARFIDHPASFCLATGMIYTAGKSPAEVCAEILQKLHDAVEFRGNRDFMLEVLWEPVLY